MEYTSLTRDDIYRIQTSFLKISEKQNKIGENFYDRLFKANPDMIKLFKGDMKEQARNLMKMVKIVVDGLNNPQIIVAAVQDLGIRHYELGVTVKDYKIFGDNLIDCIEAELGKDFDAKTKAAWQKLYSELAEVMRGNQYK
jgi:hemoglobin-like flavoprotein